MSGTGEVRGCEIITQWFMNEPFQVGGDVSKEDARGAVAACDALIAWARNPGMWVVVIGRVQMLRDLKQLRALIEETI